MRRRRSGYWPITPPFLFVLMVIAIVAITIVELNVLTYAYERIGLSAEWLYAVIVGSLVGSRLNIPVRRLPDHTERRDTEVVVFGVRYRVPEVVHTGETVLAVNVGGAIIPTALAVYLVIHNAIWIPALLGILVVSAVVHVVARAVPGVGIVTPFFVAPLAAALFAIAAGGRAAAAVAYASGTLGTLIGADLTNLRRIRGLGAPQASIGGAGTWDGVFLTGIVAVLLTGR
jgi:uncharacterized membrane protein